MGKSSKDSVVELLMKTPEFKSASEYAAKSITEPKIHKITHSVSYDSKPYATIFFDIGYGHLEEYVPLTEQHFTGRHYLSAMFVFPAPVQESIIKPNFGVPKHQGSKKLKVPTYNLKKEVVVAHFGSSLSNYAHNSLYSPMEKCGHEMTRLAKEYFASPENVAAKQLCLDDRVVLRVKECLAPFKNVSDEVLRRAFDEYICSVITDA